MLTTWMVWLCAGAGAPPIRLEAEAAELRGPVVARTRAGFSGEGYVTGIEPDGARIVWRFPARAGLYSVRLRFASPQGPKGTEVTVNGRRTSGRLPASPEFATAEMGRVELKDGPNEVAVERGWGYYDVDYLELVPARPIAAPRPVPPRLTTPKPSAEAQALMRYLSSIYGRATLGGQYEIREFNEVRRRTGVAPAVIGGDLMDYSPSREAFGSRPRNGTEAYIAAARNGTILTLSWHWNAPKDLLDKEFVNERGETVNARWYKGFYTNATTFDVAAAMADPRSEGYRLLVRDIDHIAVELKKLQAARIPVLWRPLHEAEGRWFWWGAKGPEPCKALWRLMFDRLVNHHRIDNLIWVWNSEDPAWYPGDDVVDIMSVDVYPSDRTDPLSGTWEGLLRRFDGRKMIALAEFGNAPDVERKARFGVRWLYFVSWTGPLGPEGGDQALLRRTYTSPLTIDQSELPSPRPWVPSR